MKKLTLTEAQTNELRRANRAAKNKKDADKIKSVYLLSRGKTPQEIAEVLMLDIDTIGNYRKRYEAYDEWGVATRQLAYRFSIGKIKKLEDRVSVMQSNE